jgi:hypothetical protein
VRARIQRALAIFFLLGLMLGSTGCSFRWLHLVIPDYLASQVEGIEVWRLDEVTGSPQAVGGIELVGISSVDLGGGPMDLMEYRLVLPDGSLAETIYAEPIWSAANPDDLELRVMFHSLSASGYIKVSTYNAVGSSPLSAEQVYLL